MDPDQREELQRQAAERKRREEAQRKAEEGYLLTYNAGDEVYTEEIRDKEQASRRYIEVAGRYASARLWKRLHVSIVPAQVRIEE
jgi:hypothetical protein